MGEADRRTKCSGMACLPAEFDGYLVPQVPGLLDGLEQPFQSLPGQVRGICATEKKTRRFLRILLCESLGLPLLCSGADQAARSYWKQQ